MLNFSTASGDRWLSAAEAARQAGQLGNALQFYEKALAANPCDARALNGAGTAAVRAGTAELNFAISILGKAVAACATVEACRQLGTCHYRAGRLDLALPQLQRALDLGGHADVVLLDLLGIVLMRRGEPALAAEHFQKAIAIKPDVALYTNLGAALMELGRYQDAHDASRQALDLAPSDLTARHNLAKTLVKLERPGEAASELEIAITLQPLNADVWCTLGVARGAAGDGCGAIAALQRAQEIRPTVRAQSQLLFGMHEAGRDPLQILAEARKWDAIYGEPPPLPLAVEPRGNRPLRVGYLSGDLCKHPVATFFAPLLQAHHRDAVDVCCYAHVPRPDRMTEWLRSLSPRWCDISRMDDASAAAAIAADRIDVLVDLEGHCSGNRLGIVARRPAPVRITYLGYPGTTGLKAIGHRLTGMLLDPPGETEQFCSEKLLRVDGPFAVYGVPDTAPPIGPLPLEKSGRCRFASFAARGKVSEPVLHAWAKILGRVEGSRLDIYAFNRAEESHLRDIFALHGVSLDRVRLHGRLQIQNYFAAHNEVDIQLDTFPLSGHTVICHGLWM
ncbi:MAG TPA: tetratricopeptide repeat protein, partial [Phycisphaerae bacterium]|nr:tetratricopeptide repeat protein [Phycisphaerae bacterium]